MPTPSKPFEVIRSERKSHRTKAELKQRQEAEKALTSESKMKIKTEVRKNKIAKKEFERIQKLLTEIKKDDALYENIINRYAMLYAECFEIEEMKENIQRDIIKLEFIMRNEEYDAEHYEMKTSLYKSYANIDKELQNKRKMMMDIEKENIMTIASQLRNIPKKVEKEENSLLKVLRGEA